MKIGGITQLVMGAGNAGAAFFEKKQAPLYNFATNMTMTVHGQVHSFSVCSQVNDCGRQKLQAAVGFKCNKPWPSFFKEGEMRKSVQVADGCVLAKLSTSNFMLWLS